MRKDEYGTQNATIYAFQVLSLRARFCQNQWDKENGAGFILLNTRQPARLTQKYFDFFYKHPC